MTAKREFVLVSLAVAFLGISVTTWLHGSVNFYGDGIAHSAIARKVVDAAPGTSLWQRYVQLGSPWLPVPHLLMLPFVWKNDWWRSGLAGSLVSCAAFIGGASLLFALARRTFPSDARFAPYLALIIHIANPTLLFLQATPMTESLFLATLIGTVWCLKVWADTGRTRVLVAAGLWTSVMTLTRYEGWSLLPPTFLCILVLSRRRGFRRGIDATIWGSLAVLGPLYWLWHNWAIYGNALEFLSGYYSAAGYFQRFRDSLSWTNFAVGHPLFAAAIVLATVGVCVGPVALALGIGGIFPALRRDTFRWENLPVWLLWVPPLFTAYSVFTGNIQIYPLFLNVRYGTAALPAIALFAGWWCATRRRTLLLLVLALGSYAVILRHGFFQLSVYREGYHHQFIASRRQQTALAEYLKTHPPTGRVLMHTGELAPLVADGGLTYAQVVHEGTREWSGLPTEIPADVTAIVCFEGDLLDGLLQRNPSIYNDFRPCWSVGAPALVLRERRREP